MLDGRLHDRQRGGIDAGPVVFERTDQGRRSSKAARGERAAELEFRIRSRLDSPEYFQDG